MRAIRLYPPKTTAYFIELLAFPSADQMEPRRWIPIELPDGWYALPSFRYLGLTRSETHRSAEGLTYASPPMMALANLLSHPVVGPERMSEPLGGKSILRSAKDLGRVLALARLASSDDLETWATRWARALLERFPNQAQQLAASAGTGLSALLSDPVVVDETRHAVSVSLLAGYQITNEQVVALGRQVKAEALDRLVAEVQRLRRVAT